MPSRPPPRARRAASAGDGLERRRRARPGHPQRRRGATPSKRSVSSRSAASPRPRTSARMARTAATGSSPPTVGPGQRGAEVGGAAQVESVQHGGGRSRAVERCTRTGRRSTPRAQAGSVPPRPLDSAARTAERWRPGRTLPSACADAELPSSPPTTLADVARHRCRAERHCGPASDGRRRPTCSRSSGRCGGRRTRRLVGADAHRSRAALTGAAGRKRADAPRRGAGGATLGGGSQYVASYQVAGTWLRRPYTTRYRTCEPGRRSASVRPMSLAGRCSRRRRHDVSARAGRRLPVRPATTGRSRPARTRSHAGRAGDAHPPAVQDQPQAERAPLRRPGSWGSAPCSTFTGSVSVVSPSRRDSRLTWVSTGQPGQAEGHAAHHVGRLAADARGWSTRSAIGAGHLAVEAVDQRVGHAEQALGLVAGRSRSSG